MARSGRILSVTDATHAMSVSRRALESSAPDTSLERVVPATLAAAQLCQRRHDELEAYAETRIAEVERECQRREAECVLREIAEREAAHERQQEELMSIACLLAERLVGEQLRLTPSTLLSLTQAVLREACGAKTLVIGASPEDAPLLTSVKTLLAEQFQAEVEVREDPSLGPSDLTVESELGRTDARIKSRLACLLKVLQQRSRT